MRGLSGYLLLPAVWRRSTNRVWFRHLPTLPLPWVSYFQSHDDVRKDLWNLIVTFLHWYRVLQRFIFYVVSSKKITTTLSVIFRVYVIHDSGSFLLGEWGTVVLLEDNALGEPLLGSHIRSEISLQNNQSWVCVY